MEDKSRFGDKIAMGPLYAAGSTQKLFLLLKKSLNDEIFFLCGQLMNVETSDVSCLYSIKTNKTSWNKKFMFILIN